MDTNLLYKTIAKEKNLTIQQLEKLLGLGNGVIGKAIKRNSRITKDRISHVLTVFPDLNPEWLEAGVGAPFISTKTKYDDARPVRILEEEDTYSSKFGNVFTPLDGGGYLMQVPIVQEYARGGPMAGFADIEYFEELPKHSVVVNEIHKGKYIAVRMKGDSMDYDGRDAIISNALLTGRECQKQHWKSKLHLHKFKDFIIAHKDGWIIKRISHHDVENGIITCHSLNQEKNKEGELLFEDFTLNLKDVDALFNIIRVENPR